MDGEPRGNGHAGPHRPPPTRWPTALSLISAGLVIAGIAGVLLASSVLDRIEGEPQRSSQPGELLVRLEPGLLAPGGQANVSTTDPRLTPAYRRVHQFMRESAALAGVGLACLALGLDLRARYASGRETSGFDTMAMDLGGLLLLVSLSYGLLVLIEG